MLHEELIRAFGVLRTQGFIAVRNNFQPKNIELCYSRAATYYKRNIYKYICMYISYIFIYNA